MNDQYKRLMAAVRELGAHTLALPGFGAKRERDEEVVRLNAAVLAEARILEASAKASMKCYRIYRAEELLSRGRKIEAQSVLDSPSPCVCDVCLAQRELDALLAAREV